MSSVDLHPGQSQIFYDLFVSRTIRHAVAVCSRGWGKSYFAAVCGAQAITELLELEKYVPNKNVYIIAPTYTQVTDIYYPLLHYQLGFDKFAVQSSRDQGIFRFPKEVTLKLVSYEAAERLRGTGAFFVVNDEVSSWDKGLGHKETWESIIEPCVVTRWSPKMAAKYRSPSAGRSLTISTPKGYNYLYDQFHFHEKDSLWKSYHYDYHGSPYLDPDEIERIKHLIDPLKFAREYMASFEDSGNTVFYCFDRKTHVQKDLWEIQDEEDVHINIDFNVGIQASSAFVIRGGQVHIMEEFKGHPDTETLAETLYGRYKHKKDRRVFVYPDPSGKARKTSAPVGVTDFSILQSKGLIVRARPKAPPIVDSVNAVNKKLKNAAGEVDMFVHPRCEGVIRSLERTQWLDKNPDSAQIDKREGEEHFSDGIRYGIEYLFPINIGARGSKVGKTF